MHFGRFDRCGLSYDFVGRAELIEDAHRSSIESNRRSHLWVKTTSGFEELEVDRCFSQSAGECQTCQSAADDDDLHDDIAGLDVCYSWSRMCESGPAW